MTHMFAAEDIRSPTNTNLRITSIDVGLQLDQPLHHPFLPRNSSHLPQHTRARTRTRA